MTAAPPRDQAQDSGRTPPHDLAAEQAALGGMLISAAAIGEVSGAISAIDYYRPAHQIVHEAIMRLRGQGAPADPVAVAAELTRRGEIAQAGGAPYLHTLMAAVPSAANAAYYAQIVRCHAILRELTEICTRGIAKGYSREVDLAEDLVHQVRMELDALLARRATGDGIEPMPDLMARTMAELAEPPARVPALRTGFADLDALLGGGLRPGQLACVAGRPALGKSTLVLDAARQMAFKDGRVVQYHSLEMSREELIRAAIAAEARVESDHIRAGGTRITDEDWRRIQCVWGRMADSQLHLDDTPVLTTSTVKLRFEELERAGHRPDVVVIDYLQLMAALPARRRQDNRQQEVSDMSRSLKLLAKELNVPVLFAAQLNRGPETRSDHRPLLADLRESGSLEQDCDVVILLHREDAYDKESPRAGEADFIVAKQRNGPTATVTVAFQGHYHRFIDMAII